MSDILADEIRAFATSVRGAIERHPSDDPWRPGVHADDRNSELRRALTDLGWDEVGTDVQLLPFVAPAAIELGRRFAPLDLVDAVLGGALAADGLARYAAEGDRLVSLQGGGVRMRTAVRLEPLVYGDALAVQRIHAAEDAGSLTDEEAAARRNAWVAASVGYLAGVSAEAVQLATEHATSRHAFGRPLAALDPVQQHLAAAATLADGVTLLAEDEPGPAALAHAGDAACRVTALCQQVVGAIGYTLEFPLQRAFRRARAARLWADEALAGADTRADA